MVGNETLRRILIGDLRRKEQVLCFMFTSFILLVSSLTLFHHHVCCIPALFCHLHGPACAYTLHATRCTAWCDGVHNEDSEKYLDKLIQFLQFLAPDSLQIDKSIRDSLLDLKLSAQHGNTNAATVSVVATDQILNGKSSGGEIDSSERGSSDGSTLQFFVFIWQIFMSIVLIFFVVSLVQHFAQYYQSILDAVRSHIVPLCVNCIVCCVAPLIGKVFLSLF